MLIAPCLPLSFKSINIPPRDESFGLFVGGGLQANVKQMKLLIHVFQPGINGLPLFGLEDLEHHPMNSTALFQELDSDLKSGSRRIIVDLLYCRFKYFTPEILPS